MLILRIKNVGYALVIRCAKKMFFNKLIKNKELAGVYEKIGFGFYRAYEITRG